MNSITDRLKTTLECRYRVERDLGAGASELFYRSGESIIAVDVNVGLEPSFTRRRVVLTGGFSDDPNYAEWDVSRDGRGFVFARPVNVFDFSQVNVIIHWFDHLRVRRN